MRLNYFDDKVCEALGYYVYALINPDTGLPFYIGKGEGNRVFNHVESDEDGAGSIKLETIHRIGKDRVRHVILRHGLTEQEAFLVESVLIDLFKNTKGMEHLASGNAVLGHGSMLHGYRSVEEIIALYASEPLMHMPDDFVLININRKYVRSSDTDGIYEATKEIWKMSFPRAQRFKYVLSEYRGYVRGVFKVDHWYQKERLSSSGKKYLGVGFDGVEANADVKNEFLNRQIVGTKPKGYSSPLVYPELFNRWKGGKD
jgi:hypothetical protein